MSVEQFETEESGFELLTMLAAGLLLLAASVAAVFGVRDVRHDHVRPREHALFATVVRERLERRGGGDVHVVQEEARRGDHVEAEAEMICGVVGREAEIEEAAGLGAQLAIFRQVTSRLPHHPDRRHALALAAQHLHERLRHGCCGRRRVCQSGDPCG